MGKTDLGEGAKARSQTALDLANLHGDVQALDGRVQSLESAIEGHFGKLSLELDAHLETKISAMEERLQSTLQKFFGEQKVLPEGYVGSMEPKASSLFKHPIVTVDMLPKLPAPPSLPSSVANVSVAGGIEPLSSSGLNLHDVYHTMGLESGFRDPARGKAPLQQSSQTMGFAAGCESALNDSTRGLLGQRPQVGSDILLQNQLGSNNSTQSIQCNFGHPVLTNSTKPVQGIFPRPTHFHNYDMDYVGNMNVFREGVENNLNRIDAANMNVFRDGTLNNLNRRDARTLPNTWVNQAYKLKCPNFDGNAFRDWWYKIEQFFEAELVPENSKIRLVMLHLDGKALQWHQLLVRNMRGIDGLHWDQYLRLMRDRFAPEGFEDPMAELVNLSQEGTVERYYEDFISLLNQLQLSEDYALSIFVSKLKWDISQRVKLFKPRNLLDAFHKAQHLETILYGTPDNPSVLAFRHESTPTSLNSELSVDQSTQVPMMSNFSSKTASTVASPQGQNGSSKVMNQQKIKGFDNQFSQAEIEDRRKKGLCFWCSAKYTPGHRCTRSQLYQILMEDSTKLEDKEEFIDCRDAMEGDMIIESNSRAKRSLI
ncbi:hypothetical protein GQ457_12G002220 [Hibiscus cannabinus]